MIPKLNFISALAAVVFFFLPWTSIECRGQRMATQTGLQLVAGSSTSSVPEKEVTLRLKPGTEQRQSLGTSYWAAVALLCAVSATVVAFAAIVTGRDDLSGGSGMLCSWALICLIVQAALGFPAKQALVDEFSRHPLSLQGSGFEFLGSEANEELAKLKVVGAEQTKAVASRIQVHPMSWFYAELAALGIPTAILVNGLLDRLRAAGQRRA